VESSRPGSVVLVAWRAPVPSRDPRRWCRRAPSIWGLALALVAWAVPDGARAQTPSPALLPVATTVQVPLSAAYDALEVPGLPAGRMYRDPTTKVPVYKLTSATFPAASANWNHDYAEGGDEVSLPYTGQTRAVLVRQGVGPWWLIDFTPGVGVSRPRPLTGPLAPDRDVAFTFSNNPATPAYAYVSRGGTIRRIDIRTMREAPGDGWPVTGEPEATWLHQSERDGLFVWMRGAQGSTVVGYSPRTGTKKTYTNPNLNEPRVDRAGRYVGISMDTPPNGLTLWDWETNRIVWTTDGTIPFAHVASVKGGWLGVNWNATFPAVFTRFTSQPPAVQALSGPANGTLIHGNGNWIQSPADLRDQWALFVHYGSLRPAGSGWLAPGGLIFVTANGQRRLLGHPYNTTDNYTFNTFAKLAPDGRYVLFTSDMNGAGRSDVFLAEVPTPQAPPAPGPPTPAPITGLVAHWPFDESTGTTAADASGQGHTAILMNGPVWTAGKIGGGLRFDGLDDVARVTTPTRLTLSATLTIAGWLYPERLSGPFHTIVVVGAPGLRGYGLNLRSGAPNFVKIGTGDISSSTAAAVNTWQHVAITWNDATDEVKVYRNGLLAQTISHAGPLRAPSPTDAALIGAWLTGGSFFQGILDDLRIYNRVLTPAEVQSLVQAAPPPPTLVFTIANSAFTWSATHAASCTASGGWTGSKPTAGSEPVGTITASQTRTLTCAGPGGTVRKSITVTFQ
jgi:hypothetical protein